MKHDKNIIDMAIGLAWLAQAVEKEMPRHKIIYGTDIDIPPNQCGGSGIYTNELLIVRCGYAISWGIDRVQIFAQPKTPLHNPGDFIRTGGSRWFDFWTDIAQDGRDYIRIPFKRFNDLELLLDIYVNTYAVRVCEPGATFFTPAKFAEAWNNYERDVQLFEFHPGPWVSWFMSWCYGAAKGQYLVYDIKDKFSPIDYPEDS